LDELQAQGEGRDRKRRAEAEPGDLILAHGRKIRPPPALQVVLQRGPEGVPVLRQERDGLDRAGAHPSTGELCDGGYVGRNFNREPASAAVGALKVRRCRWVVSSIPAEANGNSLCIGRCLEFGRVAEPQPHYG
jgi:hypothetical protein